MRYLHQQPFFTISIIFSLLCIINCSYVGLYLVVFCLYYLIIVLYNIVLLFEHNRSKPADDIPSSGHHNKSSVMKKKFKGGIIIGY